MSSIWIKSPYFPTPVQVIRSPEMSEEAWKAIEKLQVPPLGVPVSGTMEETMLVQRTPELVEPEPKVEGSVGPTTLTLYNELGREAEVQSTKEEQELSKFGLTREAPNPADWMMLYGARGNPVAIQRIAAREALESGELTRNPKGFPISGSVGETRLISRSSQDREGPWLAKRK